MDSIFILIDRLPIPLVLHNKDKIIHINAAFKIFLAEQQDWSQLKFTQWLAEVIKAKEHSSLLINAVENDHEITVSTEGVVKGIVRYWTISSSPIANEIISEKGQLTSLQDISAAHVTKSYWDLHLRVSKATMQLIKEIAERKKAEEKATTLHNQLVVAARHAGMADVATSVLHNIGNVLNSINISIEILDEKTKASKMAGLVKLAELLKSHKEDLSTFLTQDERGKQILEYIDVLSDTWNKETKYLLEEIGSLRKNLQHVKNIIAMQQSLSVVTTVTEEISLKDLLEDALAMNKNIYEKAAIEVIRDYATVKKILVDRVKLLQIVVNLIKNSIDSLIESHVEPKQLTIRLQTKDDQHCLIEVSDNGMGVPIENMTKIFSFGFTTKKKGHGFGLHSSALAAKEMSGELSVKSEGVGKGATFALILPCAPVSKMPEI